MVDQGFEGGGGEGGRRSVDKRGDELLVLGCLPRGPIGLPGEGLDLRVREGQEGGDGGRVEREYKGAVGMDGVVNEGLQPPAFRN